MGIFISQLQRAGPGAAAPLEVKPLEELPVEEGSSLPAPQGPAATHPTVSAQQDARTRLHALHTQSQIILMSSIGNSRLLLSPQAEFQLFSFPLSITPFLSAKEVTKQVKP